MKKKIFREQIGMFFLMLICSLVGVNTAMAFGGVPLDATGTGDIVSTEGVAGAGTHTQEAAAVGTSLAAGETQYLSAFDREVVKILPFKTPLDTIFRHSVKRSAKSFEVTWVSVDTPPCTTKVSALHTQANPLTSADAEVTIGLANAGIVIPGSTLLIPSVLGYDSAGNQESDTPLQLYVKSKSGSNITAMAINGPSIPNVDRKDMVAVPTIAKDAEVIVMGPAFHELDIQCTPESVYTTTMSNNLQTFKCQVEVSDWYEKMDKLIDWNKADQKDMAKLNYKMRMERSYLLGVKGSVFDDSKDGANRVYMCNGIVRYITKEFEFTNTGWTKDDFVDLAKKAFVGNAGSEKRICFVGSDLMAQLSKVDLTLYRDVTRSTKVMYGITFNSFETNFGEILFRHHEMLDTCGWSEKGIVLDVDMLFKYVFEAENDQEIDNKGMGIRNSTASVTTETSCPGLKNPDCHLVIKKAAAQG